MTHKVYVVTDLGSGDGGKGGVVHRVASAMRCHTVIKRGGAQGSHGVRTSKGQSFNFSQWGCGSFEGIPTHLSEQMVVSPTGLLNEAEALRNAGIFDPFELLTVDETALCATPYDGIASRIKELALGDQPRGTVGTGVGEAYRAYQRDPDTAILVRHLRDGSLLPRLQYVRERVWTDLQFIIEQEFRPEDRATVAEEIGLLRSADFFDHVVCEFQTIASVARLVPLDYLSEVVLQRPGTAIVETSHGVLTDRCAGFHPHTTAIRTLPRFTDSMLRGVGFDGDIVHIGVTRAYAIRHGAGPLPTHDTSLAETLLPGSYKDENRYQGKVRVGPLDFVLLDYAVQACGGSSAFDGLAITWFDQIAHNNNWPICLDYASGTDDRNYFVSSSQIKAAQSSDAAVTAHQAILTEHLNRCSPTVVALSLDASATADEHFGTCNELFASKLNIPVRMVSFGPTELDKLMK